MLHVVINSLVVGASTPVTIVVHVQVTCTPRIVVGARGACTSCMYTKDRGGCTYTKDNGGACTSCGSWWVHVYQGQWWCMHKLHVHQGSWWTYTRDNGSACTSYMYTKDRGGCTPGTMVVRVQVTCTPRIVVGAHIYQRQWWVHVHQAQWWTKPPLYYLVHTHTTLPLVSVCAAYHVRLYMSDYGISMSWWSHSRTHL